MIKGWRERLEIAQSLFRQLELIQFPFQTCTKQITSHKSQTPSLKQITKLGLFKMTTRKTSTCQESSKLKLQTGKQGKQNTSVPHFSQPSSTQATIALVVPNCKNVKLSKQANTQDILNNQVPLKQLLL